MPAGTLPADTISDAGVESLVAWRKKYDVSMEALLIRLTRLATEQCAAFCASAPTSRREGFSPPLQLDYAVSSPSWPVHVSQGIKLPGTSVLGECDSVGFTGEREETWPSFGDVRVDCIGVPPYPGAIRPRVVGLIRPRSIAPAGPLPFFRVVRGDATRPRGVGSSIIAHIVNDATPNWGGAGFSAALRRRYSEVQPAFREWATASRSNLRLGRIHVAQVASGAFVASLIAQKGYGESTHPRIRYSALSQCLKSLADLARTTSAVVHMPRMGAGQARGSWDIVEGLVREELCSHGVTVVVYDLPGAPIPLAEQTSMAL
jgi:hypothetical protein